jgi:predicted aspartyl protease
VHPYKSINSRPKAPYVTFELHSPSAPVFSPRQLSCTGLLDTGAEKTYVPTFYLEELALKPISDDPICSYGIGGDAHYYPYIVTIVIDSQSFADIVVYGWERITALVGRDILNNLHVCFDGINIYIQGKENII